MAFGSNKCCGCIELRTWCLIYGYLNLIAEIIVIVISVLVIMTEAIYISDNNTQDIELASFTLVTTILMLIFTLVFFIFTIVLLVGVHQNKRGHIKAFLIFTTVFMVLALVGWFIGFANPNLVAVDIIRNLVSILLNVYFLLIVRSYYIQLDDTSKHQAFDNTA